MDTHIEKSMQKRWTCDRHAVTVQVKLVQISMDEWTFREDIVLHIFQIHNSMEQHLHHEGRICLVSLPLMYVVKKERPRRGRPRRKEKPTERENWCHEKGH